MTKLDRMLRQVSEAKCNLITLQMMMTEFDTKELRRIDKDVETLKNELDYIEMDILNEFERLNKDEKLKDR